MGKVSVKANETGQHAEATSTIFRTACQSMVEQDAATQQTILRGHSLSLCKERHYYKPVRVWMVRRPEDTEAVKTGKRPSWSIKRQLHMGLNAGASLKDKLETGVVAVVVLVMK